MHGHLLASKGPLDLAIGRRKVAIICRQQVGPKCPVDGRQTKRGGPKDKESQREPHNKLAPREGETVQRRPLGRCGSMIDGSIGALERAIDLVGRLLLVAFDSSHFLAPI